VPQHIEKVSSAPSSDYEKATKGSSVGDSGRGSAAYSSGRGGSAVNDREEAPPSAQQLPPEPLLHQRGK